MEDAHREGLRVGFEGWGLSVGLRVQDLGVGVEGGGGRDRVVGLLLCGMCVYMCAYVCMCVYVCVCVCMCVCV